MIAGAYSLDLYCDNAEGSWRGRSRDDYGHVYDEFPHNFTAETRQECIKQARDNGWLVNYYKNKDLCPKCSKKAKGKM